MRGVLVALTLFLGVSSAQAHTYRHHHFSRTIEIGRPRAWCGWWLEGHLGLHDRALWVARKWASVGERAPGPVLTIGRHLIAVFPHHVGEVTAVLGNGQIELLSGNDGHAVRKRPRSARGVIAWRYV